MRTSALLLFSVLASTFTASTGCSKEQPKPSAEAAAPRNTASTPTVDGGIDGDAVLKSACLSCHTREMLEQQRLTYAQWSKVIPKMVTWGATLEPSEVQPLALYLTATYGPDAGAWSPADVGADEAVLELSPTDDGAFAGGDAERGRAIFADKCSGCHGPEARGHIGVLLVERPTLHRAGDFAKTVRKGRGKMLPLPLSDAEIADVLAHLRKLRR